MAVGFSAYTEAVQIAAPELSPADVTAVLDRVSDALRRDGFDDAASAVADDAARIGGPGSGQPSLFEH